ncbi:hypothetical protein [Clostridium sp. C2-6-12]|uniref:hypothetical protein n=1 Tax=Clostridium sp. C2-6-12 TaxID=2698832 RepID=UPI00136E176A|nr:hypothetical protein [Clostridium sp. C2-6-12]
MIHIKVKVCRIILVICIIIPILILLFEIICRNNYKAISYSITPIIISGSGLILSYSSSKNKNK